MFTGIIQDVGKVAAIEKKGDWLVTFDIENLPLEKTELGASISCSGICLTVVEKTANSFKVQLSTETLSKTNAISWQVGQKINLEHALRFGDELGGHMLNGHIDGIAYLMARRVEGDSVRLQFEAPVEFARFIAPKGSVALDGISLTINEVIGRTFGVNIIPHTQKFTTFGELHVGAAVNFEVDMIMRYLERLMAARGQ